MLLIAAANQSTCLALARQTTKTAQKALNKGYSTWNQMISLNIRSSDWLIAYKLFLPPHPHSPKYDVQKTDSQHECSLLLLHSNKIGRYSYK